MPAQEFLLNWLNAHEIKGRFSTIDRVRAYADYVGNSYFSPVNMRGFRCRVLEDVYHARAGTIIIVSEQFQDSTGHRAPRKYSPVLVKVMQSTGQIGLDISKVGRYPYPVYTTPRQARAAILEMLKREEETPPTEEEQELLDLSDALARQKTANYDVSSAHRRIAQRRMLERRAAAGL